MPINFDIVSGSFHFSKKYRELINSGLVLLLCFLFYPSTTMADDEARYDLRAAYVYNFFTYIKWPAHLEKAPLKHIIICINADDDVFQGIKINLHKKTTKGKNILTRRIRGSEDIPGCWVIYNSLSSPPIHIPVDINNEGQGYLTIGENPDSMQESDIIRFYETGNKLRFEISSSVAKTAGFTISSNLLQLARIINPAEDTGEQDEDR